jgi:hypothetical protein
MLLQRKKAHWLDSTLMSLNLSNHRTVFCQCCLTNHYCVASQLNGLPNPSLRIINPAPPQPHQHQRQFLPATRQASCGAQSRPCKPASRAANTHQLEYSSRNSDSLHQSLESNPVSLAQLGERQTEVSVTKSGGIVFDPRRGQNPRAWLARIIRNSFFWASVSTVWPDRLVHGSAPLSLV